MRIILHAPNIHCGGGRQLLISLLHALNGRYDCTAIIDARLTLPPEISGVALIKVRPSLIQRFAAEFQLKQIVQPGNLVLCFGNLPPLFKLRGRAYLYLQSRYLTSNASLVDFPWEVRLRLLLERLWLRSRLCNVNTILVQTPTVGREVTTNLSSKVLLMPFIPSSVTGIPRNHCAASTSRSTFIYVASGEPHKNHMRLIEAWRVLAMEGIRPALWLTLEEQKYPNLLRFVMSAKLDCGLDIHNLGMLSEVKLTQCYHEADALIYPSTMETFGLPLLEASALGLPIVAAERDYVRDVVTPEQTFDPESPFSIARAVKRFLKDPDVPQPACGPEEFVERLIMLSD